MIQSHYYLGCVWLSHKTSFKLELLKYILDLREQQFVESRQPYLSLPEQTCRPPCFSPVFYASLPLCSVFKYIKYNKYNKLKYKQYK